MMPSSAHQQHRHWWPSSQQAILQQQECHQAWLSADHRKQSLEEEQELLQLLLNGELPHAVTHPTSHSNNQMQQQLQACLQDGQQNHKGFLYQQQLQSKAILRWSGIATLADVPSTAETPIEGVGSIFAPQQHVQQSAVFSKGSKMKQTTSGVMQTSVNASILYLDVNVYLSDEARDLLCSVMPPLHPYAGSYTIALQHQVPVESVLLMPLGSQLAVNVTGIAVDASYQVLSASLPGDCPPCNTPVPYVLLSSTQQQPDLSAAEQLVVNGVHGGPSYWPLDEPLPLTGTIGACVSELQLQSAELLTTPPTTPIMSVDYLISLAMTAQQAQHQQQQQQQQRQPWMLEPVQQQTLLHVDQQMDHQTSASPLLSINNDSTTPSRGTSSNVAEVMAHSSTSVGSSMAQPQAQNSLSSAASTSTTLQTYQTDVTVRGDEGSAGEEDEFERWMRQDERMLDPTLLETSLTDSNSDGVNLAALTSPLEKLDVTGQPTTACHEDGRHHLQRITRLADVSVGDMVEISPLVPVVPTDIGDDSKEPSVKGVVEELVMDDAIQPQGVLVRLADNTMGLVKGILIKGYKQAQEAWPTLAGSAPASKSSSLETPTPKSPKTGKLNNGNRSKKPAVAVRGVKVIRATGSLPVVKSKMGEGGPQQPQGNEEFHEQAMLHAWQTMQKRFGEAICEAVLADCHGMVQDALQVLQDQDKLLEHMDHIMESGVALFESKAAAALAAEEEAARLEREKAKQASRPAKLGPRPGSMATYTRPIPNKTATQKASPVLSSTSKQITLLKNSSSVAAQAAELGVPPRDLESLVHMFPGFSAAQLAALLKLADGDVNAAVDELLALGVAAGPDVAIDKAAYSYAASVLGLDDISSPVNSSSVHSSVGGNENLSDKQGDAEGSAVWQQKVQQLLSAFEGLEKCMAEFALRNAGGDMQAAAALLYDSLTAHSQADAEADSVLLAAKLAKEGVDDTGGKKLAEVVRQAGKSAGGAVDKNSGTNTAAAAGKKVVPGSTTPTTKKPGGQGWQVVGTPARNRPAKPVDPARRRLTVSADKARSIAQLYYDARNLMNQQAAAAYAAGDGRAAAAYARKGKEYGAMAKEFRTAANNEAYKASNWGVNNTWTIDLHGMYVEEAVGELQKQIDALSRMSTSGGVLLKVITGRGNHSAGGVPAVKLAVISWLKNHKMRHFIEPDNEGVVTVHLQGPT